MANDVQSILDNRAIFSELTRDIDRIAAHPSLRGLAHGFDLEGLVKGLGNSRPGLESAARKYGSLEKIIRLTGRPSIFVVDGTFVKPVLNTWDQALNAARGPLEQAIAAVGRVEIQNQPDGVGTAWMIAEDLAVTNAHVARVFAREAGSGKYRFVKIANKTPRVYVDFCEEYKVDGHREFEVLEVLYIAPDDDPDIAILRLANSSSRRLPPPIPLSNGTTGIGPNVKIAVIGYPHYDSAEEPQVRRDIFGDVYGVKRLCPGETMPSDPTDWFFAHDASTLGGCSGSVVLDLAKGTAVGLHFSGTSRVANYAVRAPAIRDALTKLGKAPTGVSVFLPLEGPGEPERTVPLGALSERTGYDPRFLGLDVPHPRVTDEARLPDRTDGKSRSEPLAYQHFSLQIDRQYKQAIWTAVNIEGTALQNPSRPGTSYWTKDPRVAGDTQIGHEFYKNSGFSRGHLVRRLDPAWGTHANVGNQDTFFFTNASPQDQEFNDKFWGDLEDEVLRDAEGQKVTVFTGPAFSDDSYYYENGGVEALVPNRFWKLVLLRRNGRLAASAYTLDQAPYLEDSQSGARWRVYQVAIADLENELGIDFGAAVRDADAINVLEAAVRHRLLRDASEAIFFPRTPVPAAPDDPEKRTLGDLHALT
jgi:endonuclease G